jgi:hypothetical protein
MGIGENHLTGFPFCIILSKEIKKREVSHDGTRATCPLRG